MTITIDLTPETEERLCRRAFDAGGNAEAVAALLLADVLLEGESSEDADADLSDAEKARMHQGIMRGLADSAAGRMTPLEDFITEQHDKHGYPDAWPSGKS